MKKIIIASLMASSMLFSATNTNTGCGLGSVLIKDQSTTFMQILASTTNGISGNQTFGITFGTLNCEKPDSFASNTKLHNFVQNNMEAIALDASQGNGESLNTLAILMNVKDVNQFKKSIQSNFDKIFVSENISSAQVIDNIAKI